MSAVAISTFVSLLISFFILASVLPRPLRSSPSPYQSNRNHTNDEINSSDIYGYFYATASVYLCYMILTNVDVLLVKHFFSPLEAGYYSIAQMAGKIILFLPVAVTLVMFPKTSELYAQAKATSHLLKRCLFYVAILCGTAVLVCFLFPDLVIRLLSGKELVECIPLVRIFSVTMLFFALVYTLLFYHLSIHRLNFLYFLVSFTVLQVLLITIFHESLSQVLYIVCGNAVLLFLINAYLAFTQKENNAASRFHSNS
jgi:O-antigen/teichoic acid export membrane protein